MLIPLYGFRLNINLNGILIENEIIAWSFSREEWYGKSSYFLCKEKSQLCVENQKNNICKMDGVYMCSFNLATLAGPKT